MLHQKLRPRAGAPQRALHHTGVSTAGSSPSVSTHWRTPSAAVQGSIPMPRPTSTNAGPTLRLAVRSPPAAGWHHRALMCHRHWPPWDNVGVPLLSITLFSGGRSSARPLSVSPGRDQGMTISCERCGPCFRLLHTTTIGLQAARTCPPSTIQQPSATCGRIEPTKFTPLGATAATAPFPRGGSQWPTHLPARSAAGWSFA
jgi:hypothetical protein